MFIVFVAFRARYQLLLMFCPQIIGAVIGQPRPGSGPVVLQHLSCDGMEASLLACRK